MNKALWTVQVLWGVLNAAHHHRGPIQRLQRGSPRLAGGINGMKMGLKGSWFSPRWSSSILLRPGS